MARVALASEVPAKVGVWSVVVKVGLSWVVVGSAEERLVVCSATWVMRIRGGVVSMVKVQVAESL